MNNDPYQTPLDPASPTPQNLPPQQPQGYAYGEVPVSQPMTAPAQQDPYPPSPTPPPPMPVSPSSPPSQHQAHYSQHQTYAAPTAPAQPVPPQAHHSPTTDYESNPYKSSLRGVVTILKINPMSSLLVGLFIILIVIAFFLASLLFSRVAPIVSALLSVVMVLFIGVIANGAFSLLGIRSYQEQTVTSKQLVTDATKKFWPLFLLTLLMILIIGVGLVLFIIPGIIASVWLSFSYLAMLDENLGPVAAMKRSKELASGHFVEIIGTFIAGGMLTGGSNGIGLLTPAVGQAPMTARYFDLKALKASGATKPKVHWTNWLNIGIMVLLVVLVIAYVALIASTFSKLGNSSGFGDTTTPTLQDYDTRYPSTDSLDYTPTPDSSTDFNID